MSDHKVAAEAAIARLQPESGLGYVGEGEHRALQAIMNAEATLELAAQQRIANKLQVALVDQLSNIAEHMPGTMRDPSIKIREYLTPDEWKEIDL